MEDRRIKKKTPKPIMKPFMQTKLAVVFWIIVLALFALSVRTFYIAIIKGDEYTIKVLNHQNRQNESIIPYKRGEILDRNGNAVATSIKIYNMVLDCRVICSDENRYYEETVQTLERFFKDVDASKAVEDLRTEDNKFDVEKMKQMIVEKEDNSYWMILKRLTYEEIKPYLEFMRSKNKKDLKISQYVAGVSFKEEYKRMYPFDNLACSVIGFTSSGGTTIGIEASYDDYLTGSNGRQYGYVNSDSNMEQVVKDPINGNTVVSTIDINIQRIVQNKIKEYKKKFKPKRMAAVIADPNTGEIFAMADDTTFNLNNPTVNSKKSSEELNALWRNYCVSDAFEPGSTAKPFTVAAAYEEGIVNEQSTFVCDGGEFVGGYHISCHKESGHGTISVKQAIAYSCNDALMHIGALEGVDVFTQYQTRFGLGIKTGIDLPSETRGQIYERDEMGPTDLATNAFGQNFTVNMIQMVAGFSSLVNGGYYYEPHVVKEILTEDGNLVENFSKRLVRQTITAQTSEYIKECLRAVVTDGTGSGAAIEGYTVGGKTGTAQKVADGQRVDGEYIISFIGGVPAENPQVICYTLMDSPEDDPDSTPYNTEFWSSIMKEVLPYLHIPKTEDEGKDKDIKKTSPEDVEESYDDGIIGEGNDPEPEDGITNQ